MRESTVLIVTTTIALTEIATTSSMMVNPRAAC
jgi:hypothetical protein